jgi:uncharacterized protein DUF6644
MSLLEIAQALEASHFGAAIRESRYGFPSLIFLHLCGLLITVGTISLWDLRLLGAALRSTPVSRVGKALLPWTWTGFVVMLVSGSALVCVEAGRLYPNTAFRLKLALLLLAFINMSSFHLTIYRSVARWDREAVVPARARLAGAISLALWFSLLTAGRAIGYTINYSV